MFLVRRLLPWRPQHVDALPRALMLVCEYELTGSGKASIWVTRAGFIVEVKAGRAVVGRLVTPTFSEAQAFIEPCWAAFSWARLN